MLIWTKIGQILHEKSGFGRNIAERIRDDLNIMRFQ